MKEFIRTSLKDRMTRVEEGTEGSGEEEGSTSPAGKWGRTERVEKG